MFRFTIRDVLWLMVVVAMGLGWLVDNRIKTARYEFVLREYRKIRPHVSPEQFDDYVRRKVSEVERLKYENQQLMAEVKALKDANGGEK